MLARTVAIRIGWAVGMPSLGCVSFDIQAGRNRPGQREAVAERRAPLKEQQGEEHLHEGGARAHRVRNKRRRAGRELNQARSGLCAWPAPALVPRVVRGLPPSLRPRQGERVTRRRLVATARATIQHASAAARRPVRGWTAEAHPRLLCAFHARAWWRCSPILLREPSGVCHAGGVVLHQAAAGASSVTARRRL
jgi:hypothetical protein